MMYYEFIYPFHFKVYFNREDDFSFQNKSAAMLLVWHYILIKINLNTLGII